MSEESKDEKPKTAETEEAKASSSGNGWIVGLLLITQLAMGGYYYYAHHLKPRPPAGQSFVTTTGASEEQLDALQELLEKIDADLSGMDEDLAYLESRIEAYDPEAASTHIQAIEMRLDELEANAPVALDDEKLAEMRMIAEQIESVQAKADATGSQQWKVIQLLTSFERLENQILNYKPYGDSLYAFRIASEGMQDQQKWVRTLNRYQHEGIPSPEGLRASFLSARDAALASPDDSHKTGLLDDIERNLSSLIAVRKVGGNHTGDDAESVIARAEHALDQGEEELLQEELAKLPNDKLVFFDEFQDNLEAQQKVLALLPRIRSAIQATLEQPAEIETEAAVEETPAETPVMEEAE